MGSRSKTSLYYGYYVVLAAFLFAVVAEGLLFSFGVFFEPLLTEFDWTRAMTSGATSLIGFILPLAGIVAGKLTDGLGPRLVLVASGICFGLGYMLMSQTNSLWQLYLFQGLGVSLGLGFYWLPIVTTLPRWFHKKRSLIMGIFTSGIGVGQIIYPIAVAGMIIAIGWRMSYLLVGAVSMVVMIAAAMIIRQSPEKKGLKPYGYTDTAESDASINTEGDTLGEAIGKRQFWVSSLAFFTFVFCIAIVLTHIVIYGRGIGLSPSVAASVFAVIGIVSIFGRLLFGQLADTFGLKLMLIVSFSLQCLAFSLLVVSDASWSFFTFAFIFGLSYGTVEILGSPILVELFGFKQLGTISGINLAFSSTGFVLGPVLAGYIFDTTGKYQLAFILCALMSLAGLTLSALLPLRWRPVRSLSQ